MAKAVAFSLSLPGISGVEISINYNTANLRITTVDWNLPQSGVVARAKIWNNGTLVYDRTFAGPASGTENVPGNFRMVEVTEDNQTFLDLPPEITYQVTMETIG